MQQHAHGDDLPARAANTARQGTTFTKFGIVAGDSQKYQPTQALRPGQVRGTQGQQVFYVIYGLAVELRVGCG